MFGSIPAQNIFRAGGRSLQLPVGCRAKTARNIISDIAAGKG